MEVEGIDLDARCLAVNTLGLRSEIAYDSLILAIGADQSYFGHLEFARDAPAMKTIDHALELRGRIVGAFEMAEAQPDLVLWRIWLTFVVVGAGPTGVEMARQIAELAVGHNALSGDPHRADYPQAEHRRRPGPLKSFPGSTPGAIVPHSQHRRDDHARGRAVVASCHPRVPQCPEAARDDALSLGLDASSAAEPMPRSRQVMVASAI